MDHVENRVAREHDGDSEKKKKKKPRPLILSSPFTMERRAWWRGGEVEVGRVAPSSAREHGRERERASIES